jgi:hypothetical protein
MGLKLIPPATGDGRQIDLPFMNGWAAARPKMVRRVEYPDAEPPQVGFRGPGSGAMDSLGVNDDPRRKSGRLLACYPAPGDSWLERSLPSGDRE